MSAFWQLCSHAGVMLYFVLYYIYKRCWMVLVLQCSWGNGETFFLRKQNQYEVAWKSTAVVVYANFHNDHVAVSIWRCCLIRIGIHVIKIRWSYILERWSLFRNSLYKDKTCYLQQGNYCTWKEGLCIGIPIIRIRHFHNHLIFIHVIRIPIPERQSLFWKVLQRDDIN